MQFQVQLHCNVYCASELVREKQMLFFPSCLMPFENKLMQMNAVPELWSSHKDREPGAEEVLGFPSQVASGRMSGRPHLPRKGDVGNRQLYS